MKTITASILLLVTTTTLKPKEVFELQCERVIGWNYGRGQVTEKVTFTAESVSLKGNVYTINDTIQFCGTCYGIQRGRMFVIKRDERY